MTEFTNEELLSAKRLVVKAQVNRFKETYKSYFERPETIAMVNYFFDKVYNIDAKADWVELAISSFEKIKTIMKEETRQNLEKLLDLNHLTDQLDTYMARHFLLIGRDLGSDLSAEEFQTEFEKMGHEEERYRQLEIVLLNLKQFYDLAHRPINSILLRPARFMSKILGFQTLFAAIEEGYNACLPVPRELFESFYKEVENKEYDYLAKSFPHTKEKYEKIRNPQEKI